MPRLEGDRELWHPADCIGDCGAAMGAVTLAWAAFALREGWTARPEVLVWGASDGRARAAALLMPEKE
jgi:3-oxoacyl-[acyl-carrier-protein] synthase-1